MHCYKGDQEGEGVRMNKKRKMNRTSETECTQMTWVRATMPETQMFKSYASIMHCMQKEIMEMKKNQELKQTYITVLTVTSYQELHFYKIKDRALSVFFCIIFKQGWLLFLFLTGFNLKDTIHLVIHISKHEVQ